jgi:hypothetical protein
MYNTGTIKLTWIDPSDYTLLSSAMYETVEDALKETVNKKNWLIFRLKSVEGDNYTWEVLPYGVREKYVMGMKFYDNSLLKIAFIGLAGSGAYFIIKGLLVKK